MHTTLFRRATLLTLLLALLVAVVAINPVLPARAESSYAPNSRPAFLAVPSSCPAVTTTTFSNTTPVTIPDVTTVTSTIVVSGANPYLWDVNLTTSITHTFGADLDITIQSPAGTIVTITTDNGSGNDNVFKGTLWDDDANDPVTDHTFVNLTTASPLSPEEPLGAFIGEDPNGTWTLTISDDLAGDGGSLDSWSLDVTTAPVLPTSSTSSFSSIDIPVAIPTGPAVVSSTIIVSGANPYLWDVNLTTSITHTFGADLDITLESPAGTIVTITTDNGSGNDNVFKGTLWDDDANDPVTDHTFVNLTTASPLSSEEPLGAFIGEDPNGTWTLTISDDLAGDGGSLDSWSLGLTTANGCAPALNVSSTNPSANATLSSLASITVNFNEDVFNDGSAKAANNVANYLLVERGPNGVFDTLTCAAGRAGDDVTQTITSASYNSSGFMSTVNLASPLGNGNYRLFICGTTSIWSAAGRELNDGLSDSTVDFTITASSSSAASSLPNTGFAPGHVTSLPIQPAEKAYAQSDMWLEIPSLNVKMDIVSVPQVNGEWDVTWLDRQAGWLEGSALPTWSGNSVLTGHVWDANNKPGPFAELKNLKYGDRILIHAFGQIYTYEVRESDTVSPTRVSKVFKHEENPWITLLTCEDYQENSQKYLYRRIVRAVLISVE